MNAAMSSTVEALRPRILERRARLQEAARSVSVDYLNDLLADVDAALERIDGGSYGLCETCHDPIEADRLEQNPLVRFCLDHLSREEMKAHQQDLDLATQIQAKLLPPTDITVDKWDAHYRYQPAGAVGGDYCEMIVPGDGKSFFFALGDVAGKGVAASLLMTHLSAIFRSLLSFDLPLGEVMSRANRLFCDSTTTSHYATLVCGRATASGVELCNAGHCSPLFFRRSGIQRVDEAGLPLGLFCGVQYPVTQLSLDAGETLVLYSDGITEAQNEEESDYGEGRLLQAAERSFGRSVQAMAACILEDSAAFRGARAPTDDITLLIVRRRG